MTKVHNFEVWSAYRALHRYAQHVGTRYGLPLPSYLPESIPPSRKALLQSLSHDLTAAYGDTPMVVDTDYFSYLYLFVQLLRCSLPHGVTYIEGKGWKNLAWYPLSSLVGREYVAIRAWRHWYYQNVQTTRPRIGRAQLEERFPWIPDAGVEEMAHVERQHRRYLLEIAKGKSPEVVLAQGTWHPWIHVAHPETWRTQAAVAMKEVFGYLIEVPARWNVFIKDCWPLFNGNSRRRQQWIDAVDNVMRHGEPQEQLDWRRARKALVRRMNGKVGMPRTGKESARMGR